MGEREEDLATMYFSDQRAEAEKIPEIDLESAVHKGIEQGKKRQLRLRKTYLFAAVAAAFLLFFITVTTVGTMDQRAKLAKLQPKDWKELEVFRPVVENNITLKTALDAGYVQHFDNAVAESNGYRLTINAAVADRKGLLLLYTFENETGQKVISDGVRLKDKTGRDLEYGLYTGYSPGVSEYSPVERKFLEVRWSDDVSKELEEQITAELIITENTPEAMLSSSTKYRTSLKVPIKLDYLSLRSAGEQFDLNKSIKIAGQTIFVENVFFGPTGTYLKLKYDPSNTMAIFLVIESKVILRARGEEEVLSDSVAYGESMNDRTIVFGNNNLDTKSSMELTLKGIQALEKSKLKLIIDMNEHRILQAPDNKFQLIRDAKDTLVGQFSLKYEVKNSGKSYLEPSGHLSLNNTFIDGEGIKHELTSLNMSMRGDSEGYSSIYSYDFGPEELPQPLTFQLESYPNPILESHTLQIR